MQFSQIFADKMYLNPAYAGIDYCPRFMLSHRNQWPGLQFPYLTYNATFDKYIESLKGGIGIRFMKDEQGSGVFNQLSLDLIYSYHVKLSQKASLKFAFETSLFQKSQNTTDLVFYNMLDPVQGNIYPNSESINQEKFSTIDFSSGILFNYNRNFFGLSVAHIPQNLVEGHNEFLPLKLTAHVGTVIPLDKNDSKQIKFIFEPNLVVISQKGQTLIQYGTYFDINQLSFGLFYKHNMQFRINDLIASFHMRFSKFEFGYSYDVYLFNRYGQTLNSHEISIVYILPCDKKIRKYNTISCPSF